MQLPQININGTSRDELLEGYMKARAQLNSALSALSETWPHGRDYQTLPDHQRVMAEAQREHTDRILRVKTVLAEIDVIAEHFV